MLSHLSSPPSYYAATTNAQQEAWDFLLQCKAACDKSVNDEVMPYSGAQALPTPSAPPIETNQLEAASVTTLSSSRQQKFFTGFFNGWFSPAPKKPQFEPVPQRSYSIQVSPLARQMIAAINTLGGFEKLAPIMSASPPQAPWKTEPYPWKKG